MFYGYLLLKDSNFAWRENIQIQKRRGIKVEMLERTPEWENTVTQRGCIYLFFGAIALLFSCFILTVATTLPK